MCLLCKWKMWPGRGTHPKGLGTSWGGSMGHIGDSLDIRVNNVRRDYHKLNKKGFSELTWVLRKLF